MMYPFITLEDETEVVHSEMLPDGKVKVYFEKPDEKDGFHHATCYLPSYQWEDIYGFNAQELKELQEFVESAAHLIIEFSQEGGFDSASNF